MPVAGLKRVPSISRHRALRATKLVAGLTSAHGLYQLIGVVTGFLILRWLSVEQFAQYTLAFGFGAALSALVDLGVSGSILALVGDRQDQPAVIGRYIAAAIRVRNLLLVAGIPLGAIAFLAISSGNGWSLQLRGGLYLTVVVTLYGRSVSDFYSTPLEMRGDYAFLYGSALSTSAARLAVTALCYALFGLTGFIAALFNSLLPAVQGILMRRRAWPLAPKPSGSLRATQGEILRFLGPLVPGLVFGAFQAQISILLASVFASSTELAQTGALSRIGQLFLIPASLNPILIAPYAARQTEQSAHTLAVRLLAAAASLTAVAVVFTALFPEPMLLLLGGNYDSLGAEVPLAVLAAGLGYTAGTVYAVTVVRRWVYWWVSLAGPIAIVAAQIAGLLIFDSSTTRGLMLISVFAGVAILAVAVGNMAWGIVKGPREVTVANE